MRVVEHGFCCARIEQAHKNAALVGGQRNNVYLFVPNIFVDSRQGVVAVQQADCNLLFGVVLFKVFLNAAQLNLVPQLVVAFLVLFPLCQVQEVDFEVVMNSWQLFMTSLC